MSSPKKQTAVDPFADLSPQINRRLSPYRLLAIIIGIVFVVETIIVLFVELFLEEHWHIPSHVLEAIIEAFLYASILTVVVFPALYFFSFRPLALHITGRKQAEQQLRLQATAMNAAANGIVITDDNGIIEWVNPAFIEMTGYTREEILGQNPRILKSGRHNTQFYEQLWQTVLSGQVWFGEITNCRKDGTIYTEEQTIAPVWNEKNGRISHFIAIKQDITARKEAEAHLQRQHREIQRRLQETATLATINQALNETLDLDQILQLIADSTPKLIGNVDRVVIHLLDENESELYPAIWSGKSEYGSPTLFLNPGEGIAGRVITEGKLINSPNVQEDPRYIPHPLADAYRSLMVAPLQSGDRQQGTISVHSAVTSAFSPANERLLMRLANSAAVTIETARLYRAERNQRQLAEALAKAAAALSHSLNLDEVLETILEQTLHVVGCHSIAIFLIKDNQAYLVRARGDEGIAANLPESLRGEAANGDPTTISPLRLMLETGKPVLVAATETDPNWPRHDGREWLQSFAAAPLQLGEQIIGFLNVYSKKPGFFNQRSLRRLEALAAHATLAIQNANLYNDLEAALQQEQVMRDQLVQAGKLTAIGRMVASVAHELNNPLQTIKNCIFLSQKRSSPDTQIHEYLGVALSETQRLSDLVLQLREVYRSGDSTPTQLLSIPKILDQVHLILNQHLKQHCVEWRQEAWSSDFRVNGVSNQLKQVFLNICLNGVEAMQPDGGVLSLAFLTDQGSGQVGVEIRDTGPGILPEHMPLLFDPFFTTKEMGTGLGLAICYDIVQKHNGRIAIDSRPDQGATFIIWLPLVE